MTGLWLFAIALFILAIVIFALFYAEGERNKQDRELLEEADQ